VHPGARLRSRRWPQERFAAVLRQLAADGWRCVLTGSVGERALAAAVCAQMPPRLRSLLIDATGHSTLGGFAALVANARAVIANDTGISHIAAATGTPSVIVSSGGDAARWAPLDRVRHRVFAHEVACRPCAHECCPIGHPCALGVGVEPVLAAVRGLLGRIEHAA
jgi:ADP-heptose:LPS heptosyltransferase